MEIDSAKIVGFEGLWGTILMIIIFLPIAYFLPGPEGDGLHENSLDTLYMIGHSGQLAGIMVASLISNLFYNIVGMIVIGWYRFVRRITGMLAFSVEVSSEERSEKTSGDIDPQYIAITSA